jgi:hypothetical protein
MGIVLETLDTVDGQTTDDQGWVELIARHSKEVQEVLCGRGDCGLA